MTDRARALGLHSGAAPIVARGEITYQHVTDALDQHRAGRGWQTIAHMLGVNRESLMAKCAGRTRGLVAVARPVPGWVPSLASASQPGPPAPQGLVPFGSLQASALAALAQRSGVRVADMARALDLGAANMAAVLTTLRRKGLAVTSRHRGPYSLTVAGAVELSRLTGAPVVIPPPAPVAPTGRAKTPPPKILRPGSQTHVVLDAVASGAACRHNALADATGLAASLVGVALSSLRARGLLSQTVRGGDNVVTDAGTAELARLAEVSGLG